MNEVDKRLDLLEKKLTKIYERAADEIGQNWEAYITKIDKEIAGIEKKYNKAKIDGDETLKKRYGRELSQAKKEKTLMNGYYQDLTKQTATRITKVNQIATAYINNELPEVYSLGYNYIGTAAIEQIEGISFTLYNAETIKQLSTIDKTLLPYKAIDEKKDIRWNTQKLNSAVLQGILQGDTMDEIAGRFVDVMKMNETVAIRNARTAVTSAENSGRFEAMHNLSEKGLSVKKQWLAANDSHTREAHSELDGEIIDYDLPFTNSIGEIMFPGDPDADPENVYNCRCAIRSVIEA